MSRAPLRVPLGSIEPGTVALPAEAVVYLVRVHRLRQGDRFVVFDPERALEADAELVHIDARSGASARIDDVRAASMRPPRRVTLIQGIAKGDKMDAIVRDATELGATRIVPAIAERSVARPSGETARVDRFRRIAVQAARQCGRGDAPVIEPPMPLAQALTAFASGPDITAICLDPRARDPLGARLLALPREAEITFVVGPEGGLSEAELDLCDRAGLARVALGPLVLRTETVCSAVLGALLVLSDPTG